MRRALHLLPVLALAAAAAGGCNEYHYYDVTVTFNGNTAAGGFNLGSEVAALQVCVMSVSGADSDSLRLGPNRQGLPIAPGLSTLGVVEFSTFADSGQLAFKMECYTSTILTADCKSGEGTTAVTATSMPTNTAALVVNKVAAGCPP
jgi:hypothetical protein